MLPQHNRPDGGNQHPELSHSFSYQMLSQSNSEAVVMSSSTSNTATDVDMNMSTTMKTTTAGNDGSTNANGNNNSNTNNNNNTMKRRAMPRRKHKPKSIQKREGRNTNNSINNSNKKTAAGVRFGGGRGQRRLWQLPEDAIHNYTTWIQEKPEEDRTPNEERFLWKCMIRSLGVISLNNNSGNSNARMNRQERIREFVDRLGAKEPIERTANEDQFVRMYYKRRNKRKAQRNQHKKQHQHHHHQSELYHDACKTQAVQTFSWIRNAGSTSDDNISNNNNNSDIENVHNNRTNASINISSGNHKNTNKNFNKNNQRGLEPMASLESLRESMKKMGLSSDKLKQVRFAD